MHKFALIMLTVIGCSFTNKTKDDTASERSMESSSSASLDDGSGAPCTDVNNEMSLVCGPLDPWWKSLDWAGCRTALLLWLDALFISWEKVTEFHLAKDKLESLKKNGAAKQDIDLAELEVQQKSTASNIAILKLGASSIIAYLACSPARAKPKTVTFADLVKMVKQ